MADRAKHAFGMLENIDSALSNGTINAHDILFVKDANGKPYVGWIDKDGNKVICESGDVDLSGIEAEIATKVGADEVETMIDEKIAEVNSAYEVIEF